MTDWLPIESAPKDGTPVLVAIPIEDGRFMLTVSDMPHLTSATHWMPLPEPPK